MTSLQEIFSNVRGTYVCHASGTFLAKIIQRSWEGAVVRLQKKKKKKKGHEDWKSEAGREKKKGIRFNNRFSSATGNSSHIEVETQKMAAW